MAPRSGGLQSSNGDGTRLLVLFVLFTLIRIPSCSGQTHLLEMRGERVIPISQLELRDRPPRDSPHRNQSNVRLRVRRAVDTESIEAIPISSSSKTSTDAMQDFEDRPSNGFRRRWSNEWLIRVSGGDPTRAQALANKYGFLNLGKVIQSGDYFLFRAPMQSRRATRKTRRSLQSIGLAREQDVMLVEQQVAKLRVKRDARRLRQHRRTVDENTVTDVSDMPRSRHNRNYFRPNDPYFNDMWYINRADKTPHDGEIDHNVREAWEMGLTGRGIVVTILDDGLEHSHPDISPNYDARASLDVNDRDNDPAPRYEYTDENRHGTRCAGEVAAIYNNSLCIVGIAHRASIGGIRMLDGDVTDAVEATSLSHNSDYIDIYSASWGPDDDGRTVDGPAKMTRTAFESGIREGRGGKGSIFVWASGNGGKDSDSCNCDGYTNSIYTLSISSATENGNIPWYSEACSSTLATAYSSGATGEKMIVTTDLHHGCTNSHTGTSASAPLAAGIVALALEANPRLSWRDMQHIVVHTARPIHLKADDWIRNGVGRNVSHSFGYGLLDAGAMAKKALNWTRVPEQHRCRQTYPGRYKPIPHGNRLQLQVYADGCTGDPANQVVYLEHVQSVISLKAPKRGDIQIFLQSPSGTRSTLLTKRPRDTSRTGFQDWSFMTTHSWGESAIGLWQLEIDNDSWDDAELVKWELVLYGTVDEVGPNGGPVRSETDGRPHGMADAVGGPHALLSARSIEGRGEVRPLGVPVAEESGLATRPASLLWLLLVVLASMVGVVAV